MDRPSLIINVIALIASFVALGATTRIAMRQTSLIQKANHVAVILSFREERSKGFLERELALVEEIVRHDAIRTPAT